MSCACGDSTTARSDIPKKDNASRPMTTQIISLTIGIIIPPGRMERMKRDHAAYETEALAHFKKNDAILHSAGMRFAGSLSSRISEKRTNLKLFQSLAESVVSQQLSVKAADTIWNRLAVACAGNVTPEAILKLRVPSLRKCGLSAAKVKTLKELSAAIKKGLILTSLRTMPEDEAVATLTAIWGIGVWTAEMFLIFALGRPDVFSVGDLGLVRSMETLYGLPKGSKKEVYEQIAAKWSPHRSIACLILWRSRDM